MSGPSERILVLSWSLVELHLSSQFGHLMIVKFGRLSWLGLSVKVFDASEESNMMVVLFGFSKSGVDLN